MATKMTHLALGDRAGARRSDRAKAGSDSRRAADAVELADGSIATALSGGIAGRSEA